ncbi:hypothetical protein C8R46DRAFT_1043464 [Mycena filopes]|nr:hypothetical protein C8R46DRAFT_1043464 [Mycena filopes]
MPLLVRQLQSTTRNRELIAFYGAESTLEIVVHGSPETRGIPAQALDVVKATGAMEKAMEGWVPPTPSGGQQRNSKKLHDTHKVVRMPGGITIPHPEHHSPLAKRSTSLDTADSQPRVAFQLAARKVARNWGGPPEPARKWPAGAMGGEESGEWNAHLAHTLPSPMRGDLGAAGVGLRAAEWSGSIMRWTNLKRRAGRTPPPAQCASFVGRDICTMKRVPDPKEWIHPSENAESFPLWLLFYFNSELPVRRNAVLKTVETYLEIHIGVQRAEMSVLSSGWVKCGHFRWTAESEGQSLRSVGSNCNESDIDFSS